MPEKLALRDPDGNLLLVWPERPLVHITVLSKQQFPTLNRRQRIAHNQAATALLSRAGSLTVCRMDSVILANEALKLPAWERAQIVDALWRSLDPADQASVDQAWLDESRDRFQAYREGKLQAVDGEKTLSEIEAGLHP